MSVYIQLTLVGIQNTIDLLTELEHQDRKERCLHFFTHSQPAVTAFDIKYRNSDKD